jgi:hypothetical protein
MDESITAPPYLYNAAALIISPTAAFELILKIVFGNSSFSK